MGLYVICILSLAAVATAQDKAEHQLVQQIREGYCHVQTYEADDVPISDAKQRSQSAAQEAQKRLSEIKHLGTPGRVALLELANTANEQERWCGINYLLELKDDRAISPLRKIAFNGSETDRDRSWAILDLARIKDVKSVKGIVEILEGDNQQLYASAIQALGQFKDNEGVVVLRAVLGNPRYASFRLSIAEALGMARDAESVPILTKMARSESDRYLYPALVGAIAQIGTPGSLMTVRDLIQNPPSVAKGMTINERVLEVLLRLGRYRQAAAADLAERQRITEIMKSICAIIPDRPCRLEEY